MMDSLTLAISQGSLRRGSAACYLDIHHPEIEEFLEIRKAGRRLQPQALNLHHGLNITDEFMDRGAPRMLPFALRIAERPAKPLKHVSAPQALADMLELRLATGEPYIIFSDTVNNADAGAPEASSGLKVRQSNLCSEIMLHTGMDHHGQRTHRRVLPLVGERRNVPRVEKSTRTSSRTCSASSTTCSKTSSNARRRKWNAPSTPPSASVQSVWA